jgi:hypothetical protein
MVSVAFALVLFVLVPALAVRHGAESRPGFGSRPDWRSLTR